MDVNKKVSSHLLVQVQNTPFACARARETLDSLMMLASFDVPLCVVFRDEGVWQLVATQETAIQADAITPVLKAFPHYDIHDLFVLDSSLFERGLEKKDLLSNVKIIDQAYLNQLIHKAGYIYAISL